MSPSAAWLPPRSLPTSWWLPANRIDHWSRLGETHALILINLAMAQVVQVRYRQACQALKACIPMHVQSTLEQMHSGRTRHCVVGAVHLGQQQCISRGVAPRKRVGWGTVALVQALAIEHACQQPGELGTAVAAGGNQVPKHHALVGAIEAGIAKALGHRNDGGVTGFIIVGYTKAHLDSTAQEDLKLGNCLQTGFVHVDHHVGNDRPKPAVQAHISLESRTPLQALTSLDKAAGSPRQCGCCKLTRYLSHENRY